MFLQCIVLAKFLPAASENARELLSLCMQLLVPFQPCTCGKPFVASFALADIVSLIGVCRLYVMLEVGGTEECFGTGFVSTYERPSVCVYIEVLD